MFWLTANETVRVLSAVIGLVGVEHSERPERDSGDTEDGQMVSAARVHAMEAGNQCTHAYSWKVLRKFFVLSFDKVTSFELLRPGDMVTSLYDHRFD